VGTSNKLFKTAHINATGAVSRQSNAQIVLLIDWLTLQHALVQKDTSMQNNLFAKVLFHEYLKCAMRGA
jgi:hypothetical protein